MMERAEEQEVREYYVDLITQAVRQYVSLEITWEEVEQIRAEFKEDMEAAKRGNE